MKSLFLQKILGLKKRNLKFLKSTPQTFFKFIVISILILSSINIIPLIPEFNNSSNNKVEAATAPQWGRPNYSLTNDNYKALAASSILTGSTTERWVITNKLAKAAIPYNAATPPDTSGSILWGDPFIGGDGTIFIIGHSGFTSKLYAFDPVTGNVKANYPYTITIPYDCYKTPQSTYFLNNIPPQTAIFKIAGIAPNGDIYVWMHGVRSCPDNATPPSQNYFEELSVIRLNPSAISAGTNPIVNSAYRSGGNGGDYYDVDGISPDGESFILGQLRIASWALVSLKSTDPMIWMNLQGQWRLYDGVHNSRTTSGLSLLPSATCPGCHNTDGPLTSNVAFSVDGTMSYASDGVNGIPLQQTTNIYHNGDSSTADQDPNQFSQYAMAITNNTNAYPILSNHLAPEMGLYTGTTNGYITMPQIYPYRGRTMLLESKELAGKPLGVDKSGGNNYLLVYNLATTTLRKFDMNSPLITTTGAKCTNADGEDQLYNCITDLPESPPIPPNTPLTLGEKVLDAVITSGYIYYTTQSGGNIFFNIRKTSDLSIVFRKQYIGTGNGSISVADNGDVIWSTQNMIVAFGPASIITCGPAAVPPTVVTPSSLVTTATTGNFAITATNIKNVGAGAVTFKAWSTTLGNTDAKIYAATENPVGSGTYTANIVLDNHVAGNGSRGFDVGDINVEVWATNAATPNKICGTSLFRVNQLPIGNFDAVNCTVALGWGLDMDRTSDNVNVRVNIYPSSTVTGVPYVQSGGPTTQNSSDVTAYWLANTTPPYTINGTTHRFSVPLPSAQIRDGVTHAITVEVQDSTNPPSRWVQVGGTKTVNCPPDPWFNVQDSVSFSYSSFTKSISNFFFSNSSNRPGLVGSTFSNFVVTAPANPATFYQGGTVTSYKNNNLIQNYHDANSYNVRNGFTIFGDDSSKAVPQVNQPLDFTHLPVGFIYNGATTLTINLSAVPNPNVPYFLNLNRSSSINVIINNDLNKSTVSTVQNGLSFYVINANSVTVNIPPGTINGPTKDIMSVLLVTDSDVTVNSSNLKSGVGATGINYFNMAIVSGIRGASSGGGGGTIHYNCIDWDDGANNYNATVNADINGCRTEQRGFSYAENNIEVNYKNTNDMLATDNVTQKPTLKIVYDPLYILDFAKQSSITNYDFSTNFLGFDY